MNVGDSLLFVVFILDDKIPHIANTLISSIIHTLNHLVLVIPMIVDTIIMYNILLFL